MKHLSVRNFRTHQHYGKRRPPWIKLHASVLSDYEFSCLPDASKSHLMLIWVLASKTDNRIPYDAAWIGRQVQASSPVDLEVLIAHGFLEVHEEASAPLAERKQGATPETEAEHRGRATPSARGKREPSEKPPEKPPPDRRAVWLPLFQAAWRERFEGEMPVQRSVRALRKLCEKNDPGEVLRRWVIYLAAVNDGQFANAEKFASTYGQWAQAPPVATNGKHPGGVAQRTFEAGIKALEGA